MRWKPLLALGCIATLVGGLIHLGFQGSLKPTGPVRLYPDTPTFKTPPANAASDLLCIDFIRKDNAVTNRLETGIFIHFEAISESTRAFKNLKFIQIVRDNDGPWRIDENPLGTRKAHANATNPGPYPYYPRQYLKTGGIYLYDRPGHGPDKPPVSKWSLSWAFPFHTHILIYESQARSFSQEFETVAVGIADGKYHFLGGVKWAHAFRDGIRISDNFGSYIPPPGQVSGSTEFLIPALPSPEFLSTLQRLGPITPPD
jgi:hypothetical protein